MISGGETWCAEHLHQNLVARRRKLRVLWNYLEQKHLARRCRNREAIDALTTKKLEHDYIKRADQLTLKRKSHEDAARCAQYEGEIAMITAALRSLSSSAAFAQAIIQARAGTHSYLSREEVASYRRGLERQFVALSAWLTKEDRPEDRSRRVVNTSRRSLGWRIRSTPFDVRLQRVASAIEPEFQAQALREAPERLRIGMLRRQILAVAERDLALCERGQVREEAQLGVIVRAQMLKALHQHLEEATHYDEVRRAVFQMARNIKFQVAPSMDEADAQSLLNDTFRKIKVAVTAVVAGTSPRLAIRVTQPSSDRARRCAMGRILRDLSGSHVGV